ncbi:metallophosphoesterase family protein [Hazenella coriacea]|uniref:Phosphoesterase n=1 Tax=Hazenella coriacea TaxID=1179467 RepID=A0A4R3LGC5_9BACL|nr:metallophosphoesterase [Hazenella coriacea]TCS96556.1 hypothetical protein EDD58_101191 [Hazenella coriacea]
MKILIVSDSHGKKDLLQQIVQQVQADHVIHCGDFCTSVNELPDVPITVVRGNCDFEKVPKEQIFIVEDVRILVAHGHTLQVKRTPLPLRYRAEEVGVQIACFGHSHLPFCEQVGNVLLINPGSISNPRGFAFPTYAILQIHDGNAEVSYYQIDGKVTKERGGSFPLHKY